MSRRTTTIMFAAGFLLAGVCSPAARSRCRPRSLLFPERNWRLQQAGQLPQGNARGGPPPTRRLSLTSHVARPTPSRRRWCCPTASRWRGSVSTEKVFQCGLLDFSAIRFAHSPGVVHRICDHSRSHYRRRLLRSDRHRRLQQPVRVRTSGTYAWSGFAFGLSGNNAFSIFVDGSAIHNNSTNIVIGTNTDRLAHSRHRDEPGDRRHSDSIDRPRPCRLRRARGGQLRHGASRWRAP